MFPNGEVTWLAEPRLLALEAPFRQHLESGATTKGLLYRPQSPWAATDPVAPLCQASGQARPSGPRNGLSVAVVPVRGFLEQRPTAFGSWLGGTALSDVRRAFDDAINNPAVGAIVLDIDSPGGSTFGIGELADHVYSARGRKPLVAVANSYAASAAYWLASAADRIYATPGGYVGSIGVYVTHLDESAALDKAGLKVSLVKAGRYKAEGLSHQPLSDDAREHLQSIVDGTYDRFTRAVARGRGASLNRVQTTFGEGRAFDASRAAAVGMTDGVQPLGEVLTALLRSRGTTTAERLAAFDTALVGAEIDRRWQSLERRHSALPDVLAERQNTLPAASRPAVRPGVIGTIEGCACAFGRRSKCFAENGLYYSVVVERGAFGGSLYSNREIVATVAHDFGRIIGRRSDGSLRLWESEHGLRFEIDLPNTAAGREALSLVESGRYCEASYTVNNDRSVSSFAHHNGDARIYHRVELLEVCICDRGRGFGTWAAVKEAEA